MRGAAMTLQVAGMEIYKMRLPFRLDHSVEADRWPFGDSVIVKVIDSDGRCGYGEGKARPKITGETPALAVDYLTDVLWPSLQGFEIPEHQEPTVWRDLPDLWSLLPAFAVPPVLNWSATFCALETALVDLVLRRAKCRLPEIFPARRSEVEPCAAVRVWEPELIEGRAAALYAEGARNFRLKVTRDYRNQLAAFFGSVGDDVRVHIDANGNFGVDDVGQFFDESLGRYEIDAVEDPIPRGDWGDLAKVSAMVGPKLMLDNWLVTTADVDRLMGACDPCVAYLKVSRCGGVVATARMAERLAGGGFGLGLGSHVGETALINRVAYVMAHWLPELRFASPSFHGPSRLEHNVGEATATDAGLGLAVDEGVLTRFAEQHVVLD